MQHPFDGVTRRAALGAMAAGVAGLVGAARGQVATTLALGEEGGEARPGITTRALGEEGAGAGAKPATTEPFGEEAGKVVSIATPGLEDGGAPAVTKARGEDGGVTTEALGEEGGPATGALNENGGPTTRALGEEGGAGRPGAIVPVKPASTDLKDEQLKSAWDDLADKDPAKGVQACAILYGAKKGVEFLKDKLKADKIKVPVADDKAIAKLIADCDSDDFAVREKAEKDLTNLGPAATAAVEAALKAGTKSAEQRMRLQRVVENGKHQPELTQARRGLEVLVALGTPEAREVLDKLAKGDETEWLTGEAKKALDRVPAKKDEPKKDEPKK